MPTSWHVHAKTSTPLVGKARGDSIRRSDMLLKSHISVLITGCSHLPAAAGQMSADMNRR